MSLPQVVECDHCGHESVYQTIRLKEVGAEGAYTCEACLMCNTVYHKPMGYVTVLGYQRDLEIGHL